MKTDENPVLVLVVSDLPAMRDDLAAWLAAPGVEVVPAETSGAVMKRALERRFDLVVWDALSDTVGMEGVEVAIDESFPNTPKVILWPGNPGAEVPSARRTRSIERRDLTREVFMRVVRQVVPLVAHRWDLVAA